MTNRWTSLNALAVAAGLFFLQPVTGQQVRTGGQLAGSLAVPDEYRLNLMIRGAIVALNQANTTGNYSVLRELGTPGFQMANNPSRLAEVFAPLRARKLDLAPILFLNPKLLGPPSLQDGQILRLTGFFATSPEQVTFDLAFQIFSDQWMLSGIAVNTVTGADAQKTVQTSSLQSLASPGAERPAAAPDAKTATAADGKPIRIDLSEPAPLPAKKPVKKAKAPPAPVPAEQTTPKPAAETRSEDDASRTKSAGADSTGWRPN